MKTVLAFGTFDILHPGHIYYLNTAKKLGDRLIVIISRDESARMIKHRSTIFDQDARVQIIGSLKMVDKAVLGNKLIKRSDIYNIFKKYRPDIIALGYDQKVDISAMKRWLAENKINAKIVRLPTKVNYKIYKSSKIIARLDAG